ncbi:G4 quadruplex nucleic acid binding protein [Pleurotus ostreatus]|uniref:G4 quadruplex nucleic acid binding protein n=1 Tax=Pleurotus ostreatus TaxID=5322 RepID=A0A8H6ZQ01_PLEOS|nr:G4 quadruplex nucleic acid binding protein [Pleurotus ostreatus]KAF7422573.1 G4 quadruplex nucleic acid binding protein [Pleurotus ostreatus]
MSLKAAIDTVKSPVKELLLSATQDGSELAGSSEKDQIEVVSWVEKVGREELAADASLSELNSQLLQRTYAVSNYLTAADVALYGALHPNISKQEPAKYYSTPALTRYFDHIQSQAVVRQAAEKLSPDFALVSFDFDSAPKPERTVEPSKKKKKADPVAAEDKPAQAKEAAAAEASSSAPSEQGKQQKKEKKEKKKDAGSESAKKGAAAEPADAGEPVPSMIDLRVGHIVDIKKHPDADSLYVEQIDLGEDTGPRTVVSGLVNYIPIEEMRDRYLVAVCNLKPANMRGVKSFAMVLCATSKEGKEGGIEIVQPPANAKVGDRVYFEGAEFENASPLSQLNPKKKIFETIQPGFTTLDTREAAWVNPTTKTIHRIRTKDGVCVAPTFVGASLS